MSVHEELNRRHFQRQRARCVANSRRGFWEQIFMQSLSRTNANVGVILREVAQLCGQSADAALAEWDKRWGAKEEK